MIDFIVEPWTWGAWMGRGMFSVLLVAISCAILGVFLYLRSMSMVADALAHVALPGIVAAFLVSGSLAAPFMLVGAASTGLLATIGIETLSRRPNVRPDAAIGIVFTAMFAIGVILLSTHVEDAHIDSHCLLFGDVLGVSDRSMLLLSIVTPVVVLLTFVFYRWLSASSFDPAFARSIGIPVTAVHYGLMMAVSLTTVASFEAVGAILVIALMIVPAATAHRLTSRLHTMLAVAVGHGIVSAVVGIYVSIWIDSSAAGAIVVVGGVLYAAAFLIGPRYGVLLQGRRSAKRDNASVIHVIHAD